MDNSKRNLASVIGLIGTGAAIWQKPVVDSLVLPVHGNTSISCFDSENPLHQQAFCNCQASADGVQALEECLAENGISISLSECGGLPIVNCLTCFDSGNTRHVQVFCECQSTTDGVQALEDCLADEGISISITDCDGLPDVNCD